MRIAVYSGDGVRESVADLFERDLEDESAVVCAVVLELVCDKVSPPVCLCARDCVAEDAGGTDARISSRSAQAGLGEGERTMSCLGLTIWPLSSERRCQGRASEAASLSRSGTIRSQGRLDPPRASFAPPTSPETSFCPSSLRSSPLPHSSLSLSPPRRLWSSPRPRLSPFALQSHLVHASARKPEQGKQTHSSSPKAPFESLLYALPPSLPSPLPHPPQLFFLLLETEVANAQD